MHIQLQNQAFASTWTKIYTHLIYSHTYITTHFLMLPTTPSTISNQIVHMFCIEILHYWCQNASSWRRRKLAEAKTIIRHLTFPPPVYIKWELASFEALVLLSVCFRWELSSLETLVPPSVCIKCEHASLGNDSSLVCVKCELASLGIDSTLGQYLVWAGFLRYTDYSLPLR